METKTREKTIADPKASREDKVHAANDGDATVHSIPKGMQKAMDTLPQGHTYRDRVEAQARSMGVDVVEGESLEFLMWKIRMKGSD